MSNPAVLVSVIALLLSINTGAATAFNDEVTFNRDELAQLRAYRSWPEPVPDDPGNEYSGQLWAETLGETLFNERILSGNRSISCAGCHHKDRGFADGLTTARGAGTHQRNTQGLLNVGYQRWFGWDGGSDSLWSASLRPLLSPVEMNSDIPTIAGRLRRKPYFTRSLSAGNIVETSMSDEALVVLAAKAIGAYLRTLVSAPTGFDRYVSALLGGDYGAQQRYPESAKRGLKLFFGEGNCHLCHFGADFSNGEFHDTGRPFFTGVGQVDPGRYTGIQRVRADPYNLTGPFNGTQVRIQIQKTQTVRLSQINFGQWRTPGLRNLTHTAPYMHDGSLATLRAVVDSYADLDSARLHSQGEALLKPRNWSDRDRNDLVSFLQTLSHH